MTIHINATLCVPCESDCPTDAGTFRGLRSPRMFPFQATLTMDGNTLVHDQKGNKEKEEKDSVIRRTFEGDTMTLVSGGEPLGGSSAFSSPFP